MHARDCVWVYVLTMLRMHLQQVSLWSECIIQATAAGLVSIAISQECHFSAPAELKQRS